MDNINLEKMEIFKIYKNIEELLKTRNYQTNHTFDILKDNILADNFINIDVVNKKNNMQLTILFIINSDANIIKKSDVFLKYISNLEKKNKNLEKIIIISKNKLSTNLKKKIKLLKKNIIIENILFNILIFNITKHINYQNYTFTLLSDEEKNLLFNFIDLEYKKLNKICLDDPICIYYDFNAGDIIKIYKPTVRTAGFTCTYRLVINKNIANNRMIINKYIEDLNEDKEDGDGEEEEHEGEEEQEHEEEIEEENDEMDLDAEDDVDLEILEEVI
jgi:DNA-directed RNA polymerase subunit H (RpoH/RPB5)